jgi:hypothetical protein
MPILSKRKYPNLAIYVAYQVTFPCIQSIRDAFAPHLHHLCLSEVRETLMVLAAWKELRAGR